MSNNINPYLELAHGVLDDGDIDLSDGSSDIAIPDGMDSVQNGAAYPPQVRQYAFQLWVFDASRNPRRVVELLDERADIRVSEATIRRWSVLEDWEGQAVGYHQTSAQQLKLATQAAIDQGTVKAARTLVSILDDVTASPGSRVKAAGLLLAIGGFVAQRGGETNINLAFDRGRSRLADATDEDLERMAAAYGQDNADIDPPIEVNDYDARLSGQGAYEYGKR